MKRMVFTLVIAALAASLYGQKDPLDDFFSNYSDREGYSSVIINGNIFGILKAFDDDPDLAELDRKVTSVRIVSRKGAPGAGDAGLISEIGKVIRRGKYEDLMTVRDNGSDLRFMIKSRGDVITELLVVSAGDNETVIQVCGKLTREDVERMSEGNGDGLARLEILENSGK
jgi:hypothetical protein